MDKFSFRIILICLTIVFLKFNGHAGDKPVRLLAAPALEGPIFGAGWSHAVQLTPPAFTEFDHIATGMVRLMVLPNKSTFVQGGQHTEVSVQIKVYDKTTFTTPFYQTTRTLEVDHDPYHSSSSSYKDQDYVVFDAAGGFPGVYRIEVLILSVNQTMSSLPANVRLETSIDYLRYQQFRAALQGFNTVTGLSMTEVDLDCDGSVNEAIKVQWTPPSGATKFELEYLCVNSYRENSSPYTPPASAYDYQNDGTRIVTTDNSYLIPNIYDKGVLKIRVRALGRNVTQLSTSLEPEIPGPWETSSIVVSQFQKDINWRAQTSFAEGGKYKTVVNYADGSGRTRQLVTQNNSDRTTIVGNTIYDFTGRPAVTVLPAPIPDPACAVQDSQNSYIFRPNLDMTSSLGPYSKYHFELDQSQGSCSSIYIPMAPTSGAARYYSSSNPDKSGFQAYLPDAAGFPFSQVEYTNDQTGRIKRQGGVGPEFQLNLGHETRFFYGVPEQIELDRLFGSEVGDASHYQKNMTIDVNGQVSISYTDLNGKTIATALAGNAPTNHQNIVPQPQVGLLTADMFNKNPAGKTELNVTSIDGDAIEFTRSILVSSNNSGNTLTYNLFADSLKMSCTPGLCFNCIYELEFRVVDDCGLQIYPTGNNPSKKTVGKFVVTGNDTVFTADNNCQGPPYSTNYQEVTPTLYLNPGVYHVTKILRVSTAAREAYLKEYLNPTYNSCIQTLSDFEQTEINKITDTLDCYLNCHTCSTKLGSKDNFVMEGRGTEIEWQKLYEYCQELCKESKTSCESYLNQLLADVSPNGQYGSISNPNDPLSVFNPNNLLPKNVNAVTVPGSQVVPTKVAYWKKPKVAPSGPNYYLDANGQRAVVKVSIVPPGLTNNPGNFNVALTDITETFTSGQSDIYTYPENLANLTDFVARWQSSWALSLVGYHPEYCYYLDCENKFSQKGLSGLSSLDFDAKLLNTKTFTDAVNKNLLVPSGNGYALNLTADPANVSGYFSPALPGTPIIDRYTIYDVSIAALNMHQFVAYVLKCANQIGANQSNIPSCLEFCSAADNTTLKDKQWNTLKNMYLAAKAKTSVQFSDEERLKTGSSCKYYNACIGDPAFNAFVTPLVQFDGSGNIMSSSKYYDSEQPCNATLASLYSGKTRRFGFTAEPIDIDKNEVAYQTYLQTGNCPTATDLQNLSDALAKAGKLQNVLINGLPTPEPLQSYPELTINLYNILNGLPNPPNNYVNYLWETSIQGLNDLQVDLRNTLSNTISKTITFYPPSSGNIVWDNVTRITQLTHTNTVGSAYEFTCVAKETVGSSYVYRIISGTTDLPIAGCIFSDVCDANDFAKQLELLMSSLKAVPNPASSNMFSGNPVTLGNTSSTNLYAGSLMKIQQLVGGSSPSIVWTKTGDFEFELHDANASTGCKIVIRLINISPGSLYPGVLNGAIAFTNIISDYQNFFTMEARGTNNILVGVVKGEVFLVCNGDYTGLAMGKCDKPSPIECRSKYHENREDLEQLLRNIIENKKYATGSNNVMANPFLSTSLIKNFGQIANSIPATKHAVSNSYYRYLHQQFLAVSPDVLNDSVAITFESPCDEDDGGGGGDPQGRISSNITSGNKKLNGAQTNTEPDGGDCTPIKYCSIWFKTNNKTSPSPYSLSDVVAVHKLIGIGNTTNSGSYNDFYLLIEYSVGGGNPVQDTLFGSSCFEIKNCDACGADVPPCCGGDGLSGSSRVMSSATGALSVNQKQQIALGKATLVTNAKLYSDYTMAVENYNHLLGLKKEDTSYVRAASFSELNQIDFADFANAYLQYIFESRTRGIKGKLISAREYLRTSEVLQSDSFVYHRYLRSVARYNERALMVEASTLTPLSLINIKESMHINRVEEYVKYLKGISITPVTVAKTIAEFEKPDMKKKLGSATIFGGGQNRCDSLYDAYLNARNFWVQSHPNFTPPPQYSLQEFIDNNFCCPPTGYLHFTQFISNFYSTMFYPPPLGEPAPCDPPDQSTCEEKYYQYLAAMDMYNTSLYAIQNNIYLTVTFASWEEFVAMGYCNCATAYIQYLQNYYQTGGDMLPPVPITQFSGCGNTPPCLETYNKYMTAVNDYFSFLGHNPTYPPVQIIYSASAFTKDGYCNCAEKYAAFLYAIVNGVVTDMDHIGDNIELDAFCTPISIPCVKPSLIDTVESPPYGTAQNPCMKYRKELAESNAKLLYEQYIEAEASKFIVAYNSKCMSAWENLYRAYDDKEFHYTLYYYDQAGNLTKTIPPAGLDQNFYNSIKSYNDPNAVKARNDRYSHSKNLFVDHSLASKYVYNSLNQLIRQKVPDHEPVTTTNFKFRYPLGIDTSFEALSSQVIDQNIGFVTGKQKIYSPYFQTPFERGRVFVSNDACNTWQSIGRLAGCDINEVQLVNVGGPVYGFAVGSNGSFLISFDNGGSWQNFPLTEYVEAENLLDVQAIYVNNTIEVVVVGENGKVVKISFTKTANPTVTVWNQKSSGSFGAGDMITDISGENTGSGNVFYISVFDPLDQVSKIYKRASTGQWQDITATRVLDINVVRNLKGTPVWYAAGKDGALLKSFDNGDNWVLQKTSPVGQLRDVFFSTQDVGIAIMEVLGIGRLFKTVDGGKTWDLIDNSVVNNYTALSPYYFSANIDRVAASGTSWLVSRVSIDHGSSQPNLGVIQANVNIGNSQKINALSVKAYDNGNKFFAMAAGNLGEVYYCSDFESSSISWNVAGNIGADAKKIALNIPFPNNPTFQLYAVVLKGGTLPSGSIPAYLKSTSAFNISSPTIPLGWHIQDINTWASTPFLSYGDLVCDLHDPQNPDSRAFLIGFDSQLMATRIASLSINSNLAPNSYPSLYGNSSSSNKIFSTMGVSSVAGSIVVANSQGDLWTVNGAPQLPVSTSLQYQDESASITPGKINHLQVVGGSILVGGDGGFFAQRPTGAGQAFQMVETGTALNINMFDRYSTKLMVLCDKGVVFDAPNNNFGSAGSYTICQEDLKDFCSGVVQLPNLQVKHGYFVGENGTVIHTDFTQFDNSSPAVNPIFNTISVPTGEHINTVAFDVQGAVAAGDNSQAFSLGGKAYQTNPNWFTSPLNKIHFHSAQEGYVVGNNGVIKHTSNSGLSWASVPYKLAPNNNIVVDFHSVYTTGPGTAIVGGSHSYFGNVIGATLQTPIISPNIFYSLRAIHDIDLFGPTSGVVVGMGSTPAIATASIVTLTNNLASWVTDLTGSGLPNLAFKTVHAFQGQQAGKFIAAGPASLLSGNPASLAYYANGNFVNLNINQNPSNYLQNHDVTSLVFMDNESGYMAGLNGKIASVTIDHTNNTVNVDERDMTATFGTEAPADFDINTMSIVDAGGVSVFFAGTYQSDNKYNGIFDNERGRYSDYFWYDMVGRLVVSQDARQSMFNKYTYTRYDALGRIIEVGEKSENTSSDKTFQSIFGAKIGGFNNSSFIDPIKLEAWIADQSGSRREVVHTYYDESPFNGSCGLPMGFTQENLRKRVASSTYEDSYDGDDCTYDYGTHYSYDIMGNVKSLAQDNQKLTRDVNYTADLHFKIIEYEYDLISGNVNRCSYRGASDADRFFREFEYDADNRLTEVRTSRNGIVWESDAKYFYYKHGPLARVEYGHDKVQGVDYAYTLQGWIKGVNSNKLSPNQDIGHDGTAGLNNLFATDAFGYTLGYYNATSSDYTPISSSVWTSASRFEAFIGNSSNPSSLFSSRNDLFNGNISYLATTIPEPLNLNGATPAPGTVLTGKPLASGFRYDQLSRIVNAESFEDFRSANNDWLANGPGRYQNTFTYDANGNITALTRNDQTGTLFDDLTYHYPLDGQNRPVNNRMTQITDAVTTSSIPDEFESGQTANNYWYDGMGNLLSDEAGEMWIYGGGGYSWYMNGKLKEARHNLGSSKKNLKFDYDPQGNRIAKHIYTSTWVWEKSIYHVRDATGNILATYEHFIDQQGGSPQIKYVIKERPIIGSGRIGLDVHESDIAYDYQAIQPTVPTPVSHGRFVGRKLFELTNHLGNVNAIVTDVKVPVPVTTNYQNTSISYYLSDVGSSIDYYPGGAPMPGRQLNAGGYRYGNNGQEKDDEIFKGAYTAEFWEYDARIIRRWNVDPVNKPWQSDYLCFSGSPMWRIDPNGADDYFNKDGSFSHSTKTGSKIFIATDNGNVTLSQYKAGDMSHKIIRNKVIQHYSSQVGIKGGVGSYKKPSSEVSGYYSSKDDRAYVNERGGINPMMDDYENLKSMFMHEKAHKETGYGNEGLEHAHVYLMQFQDKNYKGASNDDQLMYSGSSYAAAAGYLNKIIDVQPFEVDNMVSEFNMLSNKTGWIMEKNGTYENNGSGQLMVKWSIKVKQASQNKEKQ